MEAIELSSGRPARLEPPRPAEGDVLVEPTHVLASELARATREPGGEATFVGRVCRNGSAGGDSRGVRVLASTFRPCGGCDLCRAGLSDHCRDAEAATLVHAGALCSRVAVRPSGLAPLPEDLDDESALLAPLVAISLHAAGRIRIEGKPYVTVLGDGASALVCGQLMARLNASVRVLGERPERFGRCEKWGVKHRHTDEVGRRQDQDVVVVADGRRETIQLACGLVRPRGKVVLFAAAVAEAPALAAHAARDELEVVGVRSGPLDAAVATLVRGELDVASLIERRSRLGPGRGLSGDPDALAEVVEASFTAREGMLGEAA